MTWGQSKSDSEIYKGLWHNDKRLRGRLTMSDGTEYDGEWKGDVMHGQGRLTFKSASKGSKGIVYEGESVNGVQSSEGKLYLPNGDFYQGEIL